MQPEWEIWLDNQLSSLLAKIMEVELKIAVKSAYILKNQSLGYKEIFLNAKQNGYNIIITKDADFSLLVTLIHSATIDHQIKHGKPAY